MIGYRTKQEQVAILGVEDLVIRSLLDRLQYADPDGIAERLGISSAAWPLFGLLWPSGAHLAARLAARPVCAERILEIGCGLALASIVGHRRGADVTASDRHPLTAAFLRENLLLNGLAPMKYRHGQWGPSAPAAGEQALYAQSALIGRYDLVMGSDLLYERDACGDLARFIDLHASSGAEVWIIDPNRGNRSPFRRCMRDLGFDLREERLAGPALGSEPAYNGRLLVFKRHGCADLRFDAPPLPQ